MLSQFTSEAGKRTLGELHLFPGDVYPVGRLDEDSEGLLLLTNDASMNQKFLGSGIEKEYWVQVEGNPNAADLAPLKIGIPLRINGKDFRTQPAEVKILNPEPMPAPRNPPIRFRKNIPTTWISIVIREGKNRQVRKMTAAVGYPTLRLIRWRIGSILLGKMNPGEVREVENFQ